MPLPCVGVEVELEREADEIADRILRLLCQRRVEVLGYLAGEAGDQDEDDTAMDAATSTEERIRILPTLP
jgi:hypothetical protein